jgi:hypothetical protein
MLTVLHPPLNRLNRRDYLERLVRQEFQELPTLKLTRKQFRRLWHLADDDCTEIIENLMRHGFLTVDENGRYGHPPH